MSNQLTYAINKRVTTTGSLGIGVVSNETDIRFVITNAAGGNSISVKGRINGQSTFTTIATLVGSVDQVIDVFTYDEIEVIVDTFASSGGGFFTIIAASFDALSISIETPLGSDIENINNIVFTSSDNSIDITGNDGTATINFSAQAALDLKFDKAGGAISGNVDMQSNRIQNIPTTPVAGTDAINSTYAISLPGGIPSGVLLEVGNKFTSYLSHDGLMLNNIDTSSQANATGAYNGAGVGNRGFVSFLNYNITLLSSLTNLSFSAKNIHDALGSVVQGNLFWNILANFNSGARTVADDYVNLVIDGLNLHQPNPTKYFVPSQSVYTDFTLDSTVLANERMVKAVGGTEGVTNLVNSGGTTVASLTASYTIGSPIVTALSSTASLTVGQYLAELNNGEYSGTNRPGPGARILTIDSATQITMTQNAVSTGSMSTVFYGGIAPVNRSSVANGTTLLTGITNTDDLQVGMAVSGTGVQSGSYIVSLVRNVSITLNKTVTAGSPTLSFIPIGKTGIPGNGTNVGITWAKMVANNPNAFFSNTAPTVAGGWTAFDGGFLKNKKFGSINLVQGGSGTTDWRQNAIKTVIINSDTYVFAK